MTLIANLVDISGPDTLLHVHQARASRVGLPEQVGNQRMHTRSGKQNRGVVLRNQGLSGDLRVLMSAKKINVLLSEFMCRHSGDMIEKAVAGVNEGEQSETVVELLTARSIEKLREHVDEDPVSSDPQLSHALIDQPVELSPRPIHADLCMQGNP